MEIIAIGNSKNLHYRFPEHQHGYWEVLLNTQGVGILKAGGETWNFSAGTIAVIPPYTPHTKQSDEGFLDRSVFLKSFRNIGPKGVRVFQDDEQRHVEQIFDMIKHFSEMEESTGDSVRESVLDALGDLLYQVLVSYYNQSRKRDIRLEGAVGLMHRNISNPEFEMSEAVRTSGYSEGYFRKIFKEMTGQSPLAYFHSLRIAYACSLFQQYGRSRTVKDIAFQSGFSDPLYFSRVFKQIEGISPQQYITGLARELTDEDVEMILMDTPENLYDLDREGGKES